MTTTERLARILFRKFEPTAPHWIYQREEVRQEYRDLAREVWRELWR